MKSENERKFRRYVEYRRMKYGEDVWIDKVHKAPSWCGSKKNNSYTVYFRKGNPEDGALMTGHGPSYDAAFRMLLDFYMEYEHTSSESEMELKYAVMGI